MAIDNLSISPTVILPVLGNPEIGNRVGLGVVLATVLASLRPGKNASTVQFDTIRKTQTWYANAYDAGKKFSCETVLRPEEAVCLDRPHLRKVVRTLHARGTPANGDGAQTERGSHFKAGSRSLC